MDASAAAGSATSAAAAALAAGERLAAAAAADSRRACCVSPRAAISCVDRRAIPPVLLEAAAGCSGLLARRAHCRAALAAREMQVRIEMELWMLCACAESMVRRRGEALGRDSHKRWSGRLQA